MKPAKERKRDERKRMRKAGFVLKQLWVLPHEWPIIQAFIERLRRRRK